MESEYLGNLLTFGKIMIFPEKELSYTQNFTVTFELQSFLAFFQKLPENVHHSASFQSLIGLCSFTMA
jgi:hypothetical protein